MKVYGVLSLEYFRKYMNLPIEIHLLTHLQKLNFVISKHFRS